MSKFSRYATCPKCDSPLWSVRWHAEQIADRRAGCSWLHEHMHYTCDLCGYRWEREPLQKEEKL